MASKTTERNKARRFRDKKASSQHMRCWWCGRPMLELTEQELLGLPGRFHPLQITADHIVPTSAGGPNIYSNVVAACWECNQRRNNERHLDKKPIIRGGLSNTMITGTFNSFRELYV